MSLLTLEENLELIKKVETETARILNKAGLTVCKLSKELSIMAFSDLKDFFSVDDDGNATMLNLEELKKKQKPSRKSRPKSDAFLMAMVRRLLRPQPNLSFTTSCQR